MRRFKRTIALVLLPALICFECRDFAQPEAKDPPHWKSRLTPEMIEGIRATAKRTSLLYKQFFQNRKSIRPENAVEYALSHVRKQITDSTELRTFDLFATHPQFKEFQAYTQNASAQILSASNGRKATDWVEGDDFYLTADVKNWIAYLHDELKDVMNTAPSNWTNSEVAYVCELEIDAFCTSVNNNTTVLDQEEKDELIGATYGLYESLPDMIATNRGIEESRTKGLFGNIMGSWILHVALATAAVIAVVFIIVAFSAGAAAAAALIATGGTIELGVLGTFGVLSFTWAAGLAIGTAVAAAALGVNSEHGGSCLDTAGGLHYSPCDT